MPLDLPVARTLSARIRPARILVAWLFAALVASCATTPGAGPATSAARFAPAFASAATLARQDAALSGQLTDASYGGVYGWDNGEVILDTGTTGRGNLLMLGESYDNAILKLMASHFDRVYSVDLRSYEQDMGKPFRLAEYLREHRITKVLLIGSTPFFTSDDFMVED